MENWRRNLLLLMVSQLLFRVALTLVKPFLPLYLPELGVTAAPEIAFWAGALSSVNFLGQALFSPIWGNLSDRYGRKAMVVRCTLAVGVFNLLMVFAGNVYQLLALRFLMGAMAGFNAAAVALVATTTPDKHLGYAVGMIQTGQMAGTVFGPAIGGVLAELGGYRGSFVAAGLISLSIAPVLIFGVREDFVPSAAKRSKPPLSAGIRIVFNRPVILLMLVVIVVAQFGLQSSDSLMALYVKGLYEGEYLNLVVAGVLGTAAVANVLMAPLLGKLGDQYGSERVLVLSLFGLALATLPQAFVYQVGSLALLRFLSGAFTGGILPNVQAVIGRATPVEKRGSVFGVYASATATGNFLGPMLGGIVAAEVGIPPVFVLTGACLLATGLLCLVFLEKVRHDQKRSSPA